MTPITAEALATLFDEARTFTRWQDRPVPEGAVETALVLAQLGPTSGNCQPMRLVLVRSPAGKERLLPCVSTGTFEKVRTAPVTAIVAYDREFYDHLPRLYPHTDARSWFTTDAALALETAFRNGSLQGAYLIRRYARRGSIAGRCQDLTRPRSMPHFPEGRYCSNFRRTSAMASVRAFGCACPVSALPRLRVGHESRPGRQKDRTSGGAPRDHWPMPQRSRQGT